jgi:hypothetical protein
MENVADLAFIRPTKSVDSTFHIPVRVGTFDSFHFAKHRQVQLARRTQFAVGNRAAYVYAARYGQALALIADGGGRRWFRPLPDAQPRT